MASQPPSKVRNFRKHVHTKKQKIKKGKPTFFLRILKLFLKRINSCSFEKIDVNFEHDNSIGPSDRGGKLNPGPDKYRVDLDDYNSIREWRGL